MIKRVIEIFWYSICVLIIGIASFVIVGSCAALIPIRWIIDWDAKRILEGDKYTS